MRYRERLEVLRKTLRVQRHEYPLGAILVSIGALTDDQLNTALAKQKQATSTPLLGELLVDMQLVSPERVAHALTIQCAAVTRVSSPCSNQFGGAL